MARRAFLWGSNGNATFGQLKYAVKDAEDIASLLAGRFGYSSHMPKPDDNPYAIQYQLDDLCDISDRGDTLVVYLSCHGDLQANGDLLLVHPATQLDVRSTYVPSSRVLDAVSTSKAGNKLVILDCCNAGAALGKKSVPKAFSGQRWANQAELILFASDNLESAREFEHLEGSFLAYTTRHFLETTQSNRCTANALLESLREQAKLHNSRIATTRLPRVPIPFLHGKWKDSFYFGDLPTVSDDELPAVAASQRHGISLNVFRELGPEEKRAAILSVGSSQATGHAIDLLLSGIADSDPEVRFLSVTALSSFSELNESIAMRLLSGLQFGHIAEEVTQLLCRLGDGVVPLLINSLSIKLYAPAALNALKRFGGGARLALWDKLPTLSVDARNQATDVLALGGVEFLTAVLDKLDSDAHAEAFGRVCDYLGEQVRPLLLDFGTDPSVRVRACCQAALVKLPGALGEKATAFSSLFANAGDEERRRVARILVMSEVPCSVCCDAFALSASEYDPTLVMVAARKIADGWSDAEPPIRRILSGGALDLIKGVLCIANELESVAKWLRSDLIDALNRPEMRSLKSLAASALLNSSGPGDVSVEVVDACAASADSKLRLIHYLDDNAGEMSFAALSRAVSVIDSGVVVRVLSSRLALRSDEFDQLAVEGLFKIASTRNAKRELHLVEAIRALADWRASAAALARLAMLLAMVSDGSTRQALCEFLVLKGASDPKVLVACLSSPHAAVRRLATERIEQGGSARDLAGLFVGLFSSDDTVREIAERGFKKRRERAADALAIVWDLETAQRYAVLRKLVQLALKDPGWGNSVDVLSICLRWFSRLCASEHGYLVRELLAEKPEGGVRFDAVAVEVRDGLARLLGRDRDVAIKAVAQAYAEVVSLEQNSERPSQLASQLERLDAVLAALEYGKREVFVPSRPVLQVVAEEFLRWACAKAGVRASGLLPTLLEAAQVERSRASALAAMVAIGSPAVPALRRLSRGTSGRELARAATRALDTLGATWRARARRGMAAMWSILSLCTRMVVAGASVVPGTFLAPLLVTQKYLSEPREMAAKHLFLFVGASPIVLMQAQQASSLIGMVLTVVACAALAPVLVCAPICGEAVTRAGQSWLSSQRASFNGFNLVIACSVAVAGFIVFARRLTVPWWATIVFVCVMLVGMAVEWSSSED